MTKLADNPYYHIGKQYKGFIAGELERLNKSRFTMQPIDAGAIAACIALTEGDYLEIGVLQGGSAILARMVMDELGHKDRTVYGVDPFGWAPGQTQAGPMPSIETVFYNAIHMGIHDGMEMFRQRHPPLPDQIADKTFDVIFIDGDHSYEGALADWENLKDRCNRFCLWHDINLQKYEFGCSQAYKEAMAEPEWTEIYRAGKMGVLERVKT